MKPGPFAAALLLLLPISVSAERPDSEAAARGREIYLHGVAADGSQIKCASGPQGNEVPAAILKCASCHGDDGRGRAEGGIYPSNIRWSELSKPYSVSLPGGRKRPPYTERLLIRAMTQGLDGDAGRLNPTMPRYRLSHEQAADLIAYLKELDFQSDPGLTDDSVTIGVMLPPPTQSGLSGAVREALNAVFDSVNRTGGIYGRKLTVSFASTTPGHSAAALEDFITRARPFVLISPSVGAEERAANAVIERHQVPVIQPLTLSTGWEPHLARYTFYLSSGLEGQCAALARFAVARAAPRAKASLLIVDDRPIAGLIDALGREFPTEAAPTLREISSGEVRDWTAFLREVSPHAVICLASRGLEEITAAAAAIGSYPLILVPGSLASARLFEAPKGFANRIFLSFPQLPGDQSAEGRADFDRFATEYHWAEGDVAARRSTLAAARLLIQALQDSGREVTREAFIASFERFYQIEVHSMRPLSFGRDRRVGTTGAHIVGLDLEKGRVALPAQWIECDVQ